MMATPDATPSSSCSFCGLPAYDEFAADDQPQYCCYGCRFAASIASADGDEGQARWAMTRLGLAIFFAMNVMVFTMLLWSQADEPTDQLANVWYELARYACLLFTIPVVLLLGGPLVDDAVAELRRGRTSLSLFLCVGVAAALGYSIYSIFVDGGHVYFEVACTILVAVTLGRWLEAIGKLKTTAALRGLSRLMPDQIFLHDVSGDRFIPAGELRAGDCFRVLPGERVGADGQIIQFSAAVDEQAITGESLPVVKQSGDQIQSGALVLDGPLIVRASVPAGEGMLARMIAAVAQATAGRTKYERLAERIACWFLPVIALIALGAFAAHAWLGNPTGGMLAALAVLVIACPCALGLATPMALWAAVGRAAQAGVLIRDGDALSLLAHARTICFDKTGTLTTGAAQVVELIVPLEEDEACVLRVAQALAANSTHPLATAVAGYADNRLGSQKLCLTVRDVRVVPGRGMIGHIDGIHGPALLGSRAWLEAHNFSTALPSNSTGTGVDVLAETIVGWQGEARGRFLLREDCRAEAGLAIEDLRQAGLRGVMLTGDRQVRGKALADQLGLECRAQLLPDDKLAAIAQLREDGPVVMVGDGINDAPALATADVGIALGSGTDISRHTADVCLLASDLARLPWLVHLSRQTVRTIRWNLLWAFSYNTAGIGLAAIGWLHPVIAAIAMGASSFLVVANSLRLAHFELDEPLECGTAFKDLTPSVHPHSPLSPATVKAA